MMRQFLTFQLYGPLAAWGDIAVGDQRPSFDRPSKSALMGLIAAALGLRRPDPRESAEEAEALDRQHRALAQGYHLALRLEDQGVYLDDYHTVQIPETTPEILTRRAALQQEKVGTKVTNRSHYAGMRVVVCLWPVSDEGTPYPLRDLVQALERPGFVLYLGRKACPVMVPLSPRIVEAENANAALTQASRTYSGMLEQLRAKPQDGESRSIIKARLFWEVEGEGFGKPLAEAPRWDEPTSRYQWQFRPRIEKTRVEKIQTPDS